jgi:hypothetical protein
MFMVTAVNIISLMLTKLSWIYEYLLKNKLYPKSENFSMTNFLS